MTTPITNPDTLEMQRIYTVNTEERGPVRLRYQGPGTDNSLVFIGAAGSIFGMSPVEITSGRAVVTVAETVTVMPPAPNQPCPFCGCWGGDLEAIPMNHPFAVIHCTNCGAQGPTTVNDPWEAWNERAYGDRS